MSPCCLVKLTRWSSTGLFLYCPLASFGEKAKLASSMIRMGYSLSFCAAFTNASSDVAWAVTLAATSMIPVATSEPGRPMPAETAPAVLAASLMVMSRKASPYFRAKDLFIETARMMPALRSSPDSRQSMYLPRGERQPGR